MSTQTQHTPAPWRVERSNGHGDEKEYLIFTDKAIKAANHPVAITCRRTTFDSQKTALSDAHLISAAPDLLTACEQLLFDVFEEAHPDTVNLARAAIAKAKGETV